MQKAYIRVSKSATLYVLILLCWVLLALIAFPALAAPVEEAWPKGMLVSLFTLISTCFLLYFWLNGMKDIVYTLFYHLFLKRHSTVIPHQEHRAHPPLVYLLYCTCNDFNSASLAKSMEQRYPNVRTFILDDSTDAGYQTEIDTFARRNHLAVVRRTDRKGFKAGNLNHFLAQVPCDYFVILDSDEIIPPHFVARALDYFDTCPQAGIVQANHIATRNRIYFMRLFSIGVDSHWVAYQSVKERYGFLSLLGHGALVKKVCYDAVGGFPHVVAEDLCFSIEARNKGYLTLFARDILCQEEYPINYLAFKKRHSKWTQGNMEFIKKYTWHIIRSHMTWFEKLDIFLFTYNLPLTTFFSFYVVINVILLPLLQSPLRYPLWLLIPTVLFLLAPMLNDIFTYLGKLRARILAVYLLSTLLLYGSMFYVSIRSSFVSLFGKAVFLVTPKAKERMTLKKSLQANYQELVFALLLCLVTCLVNKSILPVILIALPSVMSIYLTMLSNQTGYLPTGLSLIFAENQQAHQKRGKYQMHLYDYAYETKRVVAISQKPDISEVDTQALATHREAARLV